MLAHKGMADVMLHAAATLIVFQYIGQVIADAVALPIPGVVIALLLLLSALTLRGWWLGPGHAVPDVLGRLAKALHDHFGLLFVPAGAGIVDNFGRFSAHVPALLAAVLLSTIATIAVTALVVARRPSRVRLSNAAAAE
jgi:holin-like protein